MARAFSFQTTSPIFKLIRTGILYSIVLAPPQGAIAEEVDRKSGIDVYGKLIEASCFLTTATTATSIHLSTIPNQFLALVSALGSTRSSDCFSQMTAKHR